MPIDLPRLDGRSPCNLHVSEAGERFVEYRLEEVSLYLAKTGLARVASSDEFYTALLPDVAAMAAGSPAPQDFHEFSEGTYGKMYQNELEEGALWTGAFSTLFVNFAQGRNDKLSAFATVHSILRPPVVAVEAMTNDDLAAFTATLKPATLRQRRLTAARFTTTRLFRASE